MKNWKSWIEGICDPEGILPFLLVTGSARKETMRKGGAGVKLENVVALALLKELQFLEDTTGSKVSLHYLRDKLKNEVDFLAVIDARPALMIEVRLSDDSFSRSLYRFQGFLKGTKSVQVVDNLDRKKSSGGVKMLPDHEFLAAISLYLG